MSNFLEDKAFLAELDKQKAQTQYAKIILLDWQDNELEEIQGKIIDTNLSIEGNASMKRAGSFSMLLDENKYSLMALTNLTILSKRVKIFVGVENTTQSYLYTDEILWFPMGIFIMISPNIDYSQGIRLSFQLQDKMALLNGTIGGRFSSPVTLDSMNTIDINGNLVSKKIPMYQLIQELVNHFGGIPLAKILISDIPNKVKKIIQWNSSGSAYMVKIIEGATTQYTLTTTPPASGSYVEYRMGDDIGYEYVDFTYPGELVVNAGQAVSDALDSIVNVLGNFEYFFDIDGNFIFREKKNFLTTRKATTIINDFKNEDYIVDYSNGVTLYEFYEGELVTGYNRIPKTDAIKNDFVVWGKRNELPIRYHLAIDTKPKVGNEYRVIFYIDDFEVERAKIPMEFANKNNFPSIGYEDIYYLDTSNQVIYKWNQDMKQYVSTNLTFSTVITTDWRMELYYSALQAQVLGIYSHEYAAEVLQEIPLLYDLRNQAIKPELVANPSMMTYFLDFLDTNSTLQYLNVNNIGRRTIVEQNDKINCLFLPSIPEIVFLSLDDPDLATKRAEVEAAGLDFIQVPAGIYGNLAIGGRSNDAFSAIKEILYVSTSYNEDLTINIIPIYHLDTNYRIRVEDSEYQIADEYVIQSLSFNLSGNSMSISASKAVTKI